MYDKIKMLTDEVIKIGKIIKVLDKDARMLGVAEDGWGKNKKELIEVKKALKICSKFYVKKQEVVALEIDQTIEEGEE